MRSLPKLILALLVLLVFLPSLGHDFVRWDDPHNLSANPDMLPPTIRATLKYWRQEYKDLYIPVTYTLWSLASRIAYAPSESGGTLLPGVFHALNLLLHLASAFGVFALLRRLIPAIWPCLAGALFFALHPVQVESVAWISGMKDVLAGALAIGSLYFYVVHLQSPAPRRWSLISIATLFYILALLSKPSAVVVPLLAAAIQFLWLAPPSSPGSANLRRLRLRQFIVASLPLILWLLLALPIIFIARKVQPTPEHLFVPPLYGRILIALDSIAFYIAKILLPIDLGIDYGRSPQWLWHSSQRYCTWLAPILLFAVALALRRRMPALLLSLALLALGVLPVAGLVPFDFQAYSTVSDHYLYLAMLGPALLFAVLMTPPPAATSKRINIHLAVGALIVLSLAIKSVDQLFTWRDSASLFTHAIRVNPRSTAGNVNLANLYSDAGRASGNRALLEQAIAHYRVALETQPEDPVTWFNLANQYTMLRHWPAAIDAYQRALLRAPDQAGYHSALAWVYAQQGDAAKARELYLRALALDPNDPLAREQLPRLP